MSATRKTDVTEIAKLATERVRQTLCVILGGLQSDPPALDLVQKAARRLQEMCEEAEAAVTAAAIRQPATCVRPGCTATEADEDVAFAMCFEGCCSRECHGVVEAERKARACAAAAVTDESPVRPRSVA